MGQALYRTYRSKKLSEIVGQEHITQALSNALKSGAISHAYLFTGPRGVGKTSIARILAHEINKLPYDDDSMHLDIIEIDAASNRRIDEIRDLRDKVHTAPTSARYKVYIIDEVHMLTREAFNALLKTLEEPPAHVVFILATTEVHKLPETIISRTQRFAFKPVDLDKVTAHLAQIAKSEKIKIDEDALRLVAAHGEGSFRDSISLLDQARSIGKHITKTDIETILGIAPTELVQTILSALSQHDAAQVATTLGKLYEQGSDPARIAKQIAGILRQGVLDKQPALPHAQLFSLLTKLIDVPASSDPRTYLEVILLESALDGTRQAIVAPDAPAPIPAATPLPKPASKPKTQSASPISPAPAVIADAMPATVKKPAASKQSPQSADITPPPVEDDAEATPAAPPADIEQDAEGPISDVTVDATIWPQVLDVIRKKYSTLFSIVKTAEAKFAPGVITLEFGTAFYQKRTNDSKNKQIISDAISALTGESMQIVCTLVEGKPKPVAPVDGEVSHTVAATGVSAPPSSEDADYYVQQAEQEAASRPINTVSNIFGGAELLES